MTQGIQSVMMIVGIAIVLCLVNVKLAALALIAMPFVAVLAFSFGRKVMPVSREVQQLKANVTEAADEAVVGIEMVQAFGREDDVQARFGTKAEAVRDGVLRQARIEAAYLPGLLFLPTLSIGAVVYFGGRDVIGGALTYGQFFLFYQLLLQLVWPLEALGWILSLAQRATASASRSFAWLQGIESIPEPSQPTSLPAGPVGVRFEDVHFSYGSGSEVLSGIQLAIEPGEVIAICGPTGAGKTSLLNLLPRFYDPTDGRVLIGGVDARDLPVEELRHAVAIVTQKPILFSIPLRDNLTAARPDAPWDEVVAACEAAGVAHFASELPDGYDTLIGERGVNLSGGQRQRVALARALVAGARVIVLDDPMSAVDTQTERHLVENLRPAFAGRTVLIATQRLSTVEVADRAVVVDDGVIVETGTPGELLAHGGLFAKLFGEEVSAAA
jgi:ABC-type multidrug transport system fused ATPase/permease subunit